MVREAGLSRALLVLGQRMSGSGFSFTFPRSSDPSSAQAALTVRGLWRVVVDCVTQDDARSKPPLWIQLQSGS